VRKGGTLVRGTRDDGRVLLVRHVVAASLVSD
jgi:hypothetical protein